MVSVVCLFLGFFFYPMVSFCFYNMPGLHLLRTPYDLFVCDFPYDFSDIVGGYGVCISLYTNNVRFLAQAFSDGLGQNYMETVRRSYGNRAVIVQSQHLPHGNRTEPVRLPCGVRAETVR